MFEHIRLYKIEESTKGKNEIFFFDVETVNTIEICIKIYCIILILYHANLKKRKVFFFKDLKL